jgi:hypothetical protein
MSNIIQTSSNEEIPQQYQIIPIPIGKKSFEVRMIRGKGGEIRHAIFIDGEMLDWSIDMHDYLEAMKMGPKYLNAIKHDIVKHFVASVSDFIGRKVTIEELNQARKVGWI